MASTNAMAASGGSVRSELALIVLVAAFLSARDAITFRSASAAGGEAQAEQPGAAAPIEGNRR
jgi:hypothetical protein